MIVPLSDYVLLSEGPTEQKTKSGLFIPDQAQQRTNISEVKAVGPEVTTLKAGDKVIYDRYAGMGFEYEGMGYRIARSSEVVAKLE